ncbi:MAG TPA: hypothetical protein VF506_16675 [Streptosporangiaceae bacterium]
MTNETRTDPQSIQDGLEELVEQGLLERGDEPGTYRTTKAGRDAVEAGFAAGEAIDRHQK